MNEVTIGITCTVVGAIIGVWGFLRYSKKDLKEEVSSFTRVETKIDIMGGDIRNINAKFDIQVEKNSDIEQRLSKVEESTKSAHLRITELKESKN